MTGMTLAGTLRRHLFFMPESAPAHWYRFIVALNFAYPCGVIGHAAFAAIFFQYGLTLLGWVNVGSTILYISCVIAHRRGHVLA